MRSGKARVGVFGAGGRLGRHVAEVLAEAGHEVRAWARPEVDIEVRSAVEDAVRTFRPEVVVNAASLTDVDRAEKEPAAAWRTNALGAAYIAEAARAAGARVVHISTDYVFDGLRAGAYDEEQPVRPINRYAHSKVAGEEAVRLLADRWTILRVAWIYGGGGHRPDFVTWVLGRARKGEPIPALEDQVGCPTYTLDVALWLAKRPADLPDGILHAVGGESTTRLEMARFILDEARLGGEIRPSRWEDLRHAAPRPKRLVLSIDRARAAGFAPRPWREGVRDYLRRLASAP